jgi:dihydroneopterin aldolase
MQNPSSKNIIFVRGFRVEMNIGIYAHEKKGPQPVIVDAEIYLDPDLRWIEDNIEKTVSYEDIAGRIQKISETRHFDLLETFLEDVAKNIVNLHAVHYVDISAQKPGIINNAYEAGVKICRMKSDY